LIVVDASALVAIADWEPERNLYVAALEAAQDAVIASINAVETGLILIGRRRLRDVDELNIWLTELGVEVEATAPSHSTALAAYLSYGRNYHPARLNLADCFAYALAKQLDAPLLYKGNDFALTDVRSALQPT
jgi:ribonuclease VapC